MHRRSQWIVFCLVGLALFLTTAPCEACPTCRQGLADGQHEHMIRGYFWSIIFMMSMPFVIFGSLGTYFYLQVLKARAGQGAAGSTSNLVAPSYERLHYADGVESTSVDQRTTKV